MKAKTIIFPSTLVLLLAITAYAGYYYYHASLFLNESLYVEKNTRDFELLISESVKSLPVIAAIEGSVKYHYSAGDGNKPQSDSLEFDTNKQKTFVLEEYANYLQGRGYIPKQPENVTDNNVIYGNEKEIFNVYVENANNTNQVTIYHLEIMDQQAKTQ